LAQIKTAATAAPAATATKAAATPAATVAPSTATTTTTTAATPAATTVAVTTTGTVSRTTPVTTTGTTTATTGTSTGTGTIIDVAVANGAFKTLIAALQATGLENTLKGPGPFTVFAPTDAAFARLPAGALQQLMANPSGQLTDIVRYHVIPSKLMAADLSNGLQATTVQGKPVKFEVSGNTIKINGAQIITKDIQASNGVIHVIENVIIPPAE
ncbi:MAG: fasciclin domain-containing protein, partial [Chloroflexi bacterium]|nr:fasciclin domain-containing protein [Chloroflexota bacterium]